MLNNVSGDKDAGITADHRPKKTINDMLNGVDKEMEYTIKLITNKQ
jgi:hypothetical protein